MKICFDNIKIAAIASWLPQNNLEMISLASEYGEKEVEKIIKATGVERSRIADSEDTASDICFRAAKHLIEQEEIDKSDIDGLLLVSQTTDYLLPATSICLQDRLGLSKDTICLDIHYGCSGYIYGIFQAALWIHSGICKNVLVLAGDTTSKMIHPKDKSLRMVFGDCGTASLITKGSQPMGISIHSDGSGFDRLIVAAGGFRNPVSEKTSELRYDEDGNGRTENNLYMDGVAIFNFALMNVHHDINMLIERMKWQKEEVNLFALHQANEFMVNYIRKKIKVSPEKIPTNVTNYGNTGPASIPLLFSDLCTTTSYNLEKVIMSGFGVGLSWGSIACNMSDTKFYEPINKYIYGK
ncbi:3-oxoacyl-[acyl-carrier-protein] synthase 3 [termite gut metagenome]|uniref:3-oxoacyl-[acyl-carrier-protein] synthase 3 n=1 Tax=termite gut metagenome TaxID=433724 RepID=A0A5J4SQJ5_9ZZZZ